jgi:predicted GH43/DUF377 family glycosyl hydrolase
MGKFFICLFVVITFFVQAYSQTEWVRDPNNPVLQRGNSGEFDSQLVENPYVLFDGTGYHMWYAGGAGTGTVRIGYAYSSDGINNWTKQLNPVLQPGPSGSWDAGTVFQPCVLFDGTTYHMWYGGHNGINNRQIGYATSSDGINWDKHLSNPVVGPGTSGTWEDQWVDSPDVLLIDGVYHMWYSGSDGTTTRIGHAISSNGITWEKDTLNPVLEDGATWVAVGVYQPSVLFDGTRYHMWYSGGGVFLSSIGYAKSFDGRNWKKEPTLVQGSNPVLEPGPSGSWDDQYVGLCGVIFDDVESIFKMWYSGGVGFALGDIGYATLNDPLPVELTSFTATINGNEVILNWSTATELNNLGFEIQRSTAGKEFFNVGFVNGHGTTSEHQDYHYTDKNLNNGKYYYRLKQIDFDGSYEYSNVIELEWRAFNSYLLEQNYPNPFNPITTIGFGVQNRSNVKITVLNSIGEEVAVVLNENKEQGFYQIEFNATNIPSGVYFYQLQAGNFVESKKMILLK